MFNQEELQVFSWGLSERAVSILLKEPEILEDLKKIRELPPLPSSFKAKVLQILFDDVTHIYHEVGKGDYYHPCSPDFEPTFSEYRLDEETILFHVGGEIVIDRTANLDYAKILKSLKLKAISS